MFCLVTKPTFVPSWPQLLDGSYKHNPKLIVSEELRKSIAPSVYLLFSPFRKINLEMLYNKRFHEVLSLISFSCLLL